MEQEIGAGLNKRMQKCLYYMGPGENWAGRGDSFLSEQLGE